MSSWMRSGLQTVVDSSRRLKEELLQNAGVYGAGCVDPVLEARAQRFNQHSMSIERLFTATNEYMVQMDAASRASTNLIHEFKAFFNMQMSQPGKQDAELDALVRQLAQASDCLETIQWTLKQSVQDASNVTLTEKVLKPLTRMKLQNADIQKTLQVRKQKILDFDALRRSTGSSKLSPETQNKLRSSEEAVAKITADLNDAFDTLDDKRGYILRNEFISLTASSIFISRKNQIAFEQLLPLIPGVAYHIADLNNFKAFSHNADPTQNATLGILDYSGPNSCLESPVNNMTHVDIPPIEITRIVANTPFQTLHSITKLIEETYYAIEPHRTSTNALEPPKKETESALDSSGLDWMS
ncbi:Aste57867_14258 [Aphanomyces stellatus]|uniref:Aste57867_14258 protein n=1 Tax=Aphanomyces stellatus TaxID=120398 RepID=A0A485L0S8_9STRA|nr:hypothetical protein As57867_014207 [Aphanomyces stellatus]VFT91083.1 Aste57867_14258 [Aphanomyces stellatus]